MLVFLVGGFATSPLLEDAIREAFPHLRLLRPEHPIVAIGRGAILFAVQRGTLKSRIAAKTYGFKATREWTDAHLYQKRRKVWVKKYGVPVGVCEDHFGIMIEAGEEVTSAAILRRFNTVVDNQRYVELNIYSSINKSPEWIDERGCSLLGTIELEIEPRLLCASEQRIELSFFFGGTELLIKMRDLASDKSTFAKINHFDEPSKSLFLPV